MSELVTKNELVRMEDIEEFKTEFHKELDAFNVKYKGIVYDLDDPVINKQAKSDKFAIGKVISRLDKRHAELKAPAKKITDTVDAVRKELKDEFLDTQDCIKNQLKAHDDAIQAHAEKLQGMVEEIRGLAEFDPDIMLNSSRIKERLDIVNGFDIDDSYEHRKADATLAQVETVKTLTTMLADCVQREEEKKELDRLREEAEARAKADEEERLRKEGEERARKEAEAMAKEEEEKKAKALKDAETARLSAVRAKEKAQREAIEAQEQAKTDAIIAKEKAKIDAERAAQAERDRIEAERIKKDEEEKAREANKKHCAKINNAAAKAMRDALMAYDTGENPITINQAKLIIKAIAKKQIPNVNISY